MKASTYNFLGSLYILTSSGAFKHTKVGWEQTKHLPTTIRLYGRKLTEFNNFKFK